MEGGKGGQGMRADTAGRMRWTLEKICFAKDSWDVHEHAVQRAQNNNDQAFTTLAVYTGRYGDVTSQHAA